MLAELTSAELAILLKLLDTVLHGAAKTAEAEPIPLDGRRNRGPRTR